LKGAGAMIGFWILIMVIVLVLIGGLWWIIEVGTKNTSRTKVIGFILTVVIFAGGIFSGNWWLDNTASGVRMRVSWRTEIEIGLNRTIQVFTATGELVYEYSGRFDVDQTSERIIIDIMDESNDNSRRVYISAPAGVVIIEEI